MLEPQAVLLLPRSTADGIPVALESTFPGCKSGCRNLEPAREALDRVLLPALGCNSFPGMGVVGGLLVLSLCPCEHVLVALRWLCNRHPFPAAYLWEGLSPL